MKRAALMPVLLCSLVLCCVLLGGIRTASADAYDLVVFDGVFGGTVSKFNGQRKWQPTLWLDGSYGVAGPLHIGGYFQWLGKSWPLDDPGFGGGAVLALHPRGGHRHGRRVRGPWVWFSRLVGIGSARPVDAVLQDAVRRAEPRVEHRSRLQLLHQLEYGSFSAL
ncbi:MAG: hypothetical protein JRD94_06305 [Deltaproteobacteria bacterium]|nr:hypothetical protein [Deltaproteobacteria bacterium]